jgi:hypothetical protein
MPWHLIIRNKKQVCQPKKLFTFYPDVDGLGDPLARTGNVFLASSSYKLCPIHFWHYLVFLERMAFSSREEDISA